jgi:hypothetical protein
MMAYERESLIEKHLVAEVKKAGGVAFKFVSPVAARYRIALSCYPAAVSSLLNAKHPANHHAPTSCASTNGCARWALPWWCWIAKIWRGYCAKSPTTQ